MVEQSERDHHYMNVCLNLAVEAAARNEVPVGAIVVHHRSDDPYADQIIGTGFNLRETTHDPTAHAEIVAMRRASQVLGQWRLDECTLYVTLEPCPMCAGAIVNARIKRVVYGCHDPKAGAGRSVFTLMDDSRLNHRAEISHGILSDRCAHVLTSFFQRRRAENKRARLATQTEDKTPST